MPDGDNMPANRIIAEIHQRTWSKGRWSFILREDGTVEAIYRRASRYDSFTIHASVLRSTPIRERHRAVGMMVTTIVLTIFDLLFFITALLCPDTDDVRIAFLCVGCVFLIPPLLCLWQYYKESSQTVIFFGPLLGTSIVLLDGLPSRTDFEKFVQDLAGTIFRLQVTRQTADPTDVVDRIKELAFMRQQNTISDDEFRKLKQEIIALRHPGEGIGFQPR